MFSKTNKPILFGFMFMLTITSAVADPVFRGQSISDPILRADLMRDISATFAALNQCPVEQVQAQIVAVEKGAQFEACKDIKQKWHPMCIQSVVEAWQSTGCQHKMDTLITLRPDERGETDYSIQILPKK